MIKRAHQVQSADNVSTHWFCPEKRLADICARTQVILKLELRGLSRYPLRYILLQCSLGASLSRRAHPTLPLPLAWQLFRVLFSNPGVYAYVDMVHDRKEQWTGNSFSKGLGCALKLPVQRVHPLSRPLSTKLDGAKLNIMEGDTLLL